MLKKLSENSVNAVLIEKQAPVALTDALTAAGYEVILIDTLSAGTPEMGGQAYFGRIYENAREIQRALRK